MKKVVLSFILSLALLLTATACNGYNEPIGEMEKGEKTSEHSSEKSPQQGQENPFEAQQEILIEEQPLALEPQTPKADPIPIDQIPEEYFNLDINTLTPSGNRQNSPNVFYEDENGIRFEFDGITGEFRGFKPLYIGDDPNVSDTDLEVIEKAAVELASRFINVDEYELDYFLAEGTAVHKFNYCKVVGGYKTTDMGWVWITKKGYINLVAFENLGRFDNIDPSEINKKSLDRKFKQDFNEKYKQVLDNIIDYEIIERTLELKDSQLYIRYDYIYSFISYGEVYKSRDDIYMSICPVDCGCEYCTGSDTDPNACAACKICKSGKPSVKGCITGGEFPTIFDALEILKSLIGIENQIDKCSNARYASLITAQSQEKGAPTIFDALEILKRVAGDMKCDL